MPSESFESTHKKISPTQDGDDDEYDFGGSAEVCWGHLQTCLLFFTTTPQGPV